MTRHLSMAECAILQCMAAGMTTREIATQRQRSVNTVKGQINLIYIKLDARCKTDAVVKGMRLGIVS